jgi:hypothetical protein
MNAIKYKLTRRKAILLGLVIVGLFISCDDLLNTTSPVSVSSATIFDTPERIEGLINGAYKSLKSGNLYSGQILFYGDARAEEFVSRSENALAGGYIWGNNFNNLTNEVNNIWGELYALINKTNILIAGLHASTGVIDDELKNNYLAEAHFIRALAYYHLVTIYGRPYLEDNGEGKAVPLRLQPELSSANNDIERSTVKDVYAQIITDLDFAESNLLDTYATNILNTTRAHKNTAIALKTRVYLNQGRFDKVAEEATKIVPQDVAPFSATSGVNHALQDNIMHIFTSNYITSESIFSVPMTASDPPSGSALASRYYSNRDFVLNSDENGIISNTEWRSSDQRRGFILYDQNLNVSILAKYTKTSPAIDYIPVIRYAEVLLNYAEAEAREGNLTKAIALLEAIRTRSDSNYTFPSSALSRDEILHTIRIERRIELLGEGFRTNDILRDLLTFPTKPSLSSLTPRQVRPSDDGYIFPIPNSEILTNKLINK